MSSIYPRECLTLSAAVKIGGRWARTKVQLWSATTHTVTHLITSRRLYAYDSVNCSLSHPPRVQPLPSPLSPF